MFMARCLVGEKHEEILFYHKIIQGENNMSDCVNKLMYQFINYSFRESCLCSDVTDDDLT